MVYSFDLGLNLKELYFPKLNLTFCQSCFIYRIKITASSWSSFFTLWGLSKVFLLFFPMLLSCGMTSSVTAFLCTSTRLISHHPSVTGWNGSFFSIIMWIQVELLWCLVFSTLCCKDGFRTLGWKSLMFASFPRLTTSGYFLLYNKKINKFGKIKHTRQDFN